MKINRFFCSILLISVLVLAGCNTAQPAPAQPTAPPAPTTDLGVVRTQAAQTVVAQITADALANPTAVPTEAPTQTAMPSATLAPATSTPAPTLTPTRSSSGGGGGGGGGYVGPTATAYTDRAVLTGQSIADGAQFPTGYDFDVSWTFKNTGYRDWNTQFYIKFLSGDLKPKNDIYMLPKAVKKNESISITADFLAPSTPGRYESNWALYNDDGTQIYHFFIVINVY